MTKLHIFSLFYEADHEAFMMAYAKYLVEDVTISKVELFLTYTKLSIRYGEVTKYILKTLELYIMGYMYTPYY